MRIKKKIITECKVEKIKIPYKKFIYILKGVQTKLDKSQKIMDLDMQTCYI